MAVVYITGKPAGRRGVHSCACPVCADCYLCEFGSCSTYSDGFIRIPNVENLEQLERISKKAKIERIIGA